MSGQIRAAIIGCGYWGINYIRLFNEMSQVSIEVVCDASMERLEQIQEKFPHIKVTTDLDELVNKYIVDIAVVCTPAVTHHKVARKLLENGIHVLIEKPLTTHAEDAKELTYLAEIQHKKLMVGHIFLFNPGIQAIKTYIDDHSIGQIYYLYAKRTNLGPIRNDVNASWDLATHDVSVFNYLLGRVPDWVSAVGSRLLSRELEDVSFITLNYGNGLNAHIHVSWADPNKERECVIVGSKMRISFNDIDPREKVRIFEKGIVPLLEPSGYGEFQLSTRDGDIFSPSIPITEPLRNQVTHFLDCVTHDHEPISNGQNGWNVVRVMEAIDQSMMLDGKPVIVGQKEELAWVH